MLLRFGCAFFLVLSSVPGADAFVSPGLQRFGAGLTRLTAAAAGEEENEEEASPGGSKFKDLLRQAQAAKEQGNLEPEVGFRRPIDRSRSQKNGTSKICARRTNSNSFRAFLQSVKSDKRSITYGLRIVYEN